MQERGILVWAPTITVGMKPRTIVLWILLSLPGLVAAECDCGDIDFVAVANSGSFGGAAARLDLSQSAVSHAIATLESELGEIDQYRAIKS